MAFRLLNPSLFHLRTPFLAASLGFSGALLIHQTFHSRRLLRLDSLSSPATSPKDWSFSQYQQDARTPVTKGDGTLNPNAIRQLSLGSILGLVGGLGISLFSKPLALLIGLLVVGVQTAEYYGIRLIPYSKLQGYVKGVDLRSAVQDNVAFKLSFGTLFALSAFAEF
ncbi:hypothetical protein LTR91_006708 [Friedmanniomyces endolithicus]|uniref:FUN14 domain-containing protein n=1 Tax=Friedmanniomyces endolithicus TaxID=329885 RepID=A0AAN6KQY3_9PEZI|nr:hypothetical protein LTR75_013323 [Friedmanniomyces endolithicus]KAK0798986.1 hypothetical protein LTR59_006232 [Friedmanniomyces endolithicus]KAK0803554.1 hypothetical protein LTR38_006128 [Friedmanniomyces endolithicus]KAK0899823.1 hypothetical protein LTR02_009468 [Friedmanniomyces endolithicus]KAK0997269.1 hypothetical protein LTR91_006708 [Friedmanniomyces endolithicus]